DPGPPEDLVVDVVVVVTSAGFLDDRTQKQVPGVAVFVDGARDRPGGNTGVHRGDEVVERAEALLDPRVPRVREVVAGPGGVREEHRDGDAVAHGFRVARQVFRERLAQTELARVGGRYVRA